MPQSLGHAIIHLVFSTKERQASIHLEEEQELYTYMTAVAGKHRCHIYAIGGMSDHVHILLNQHRTICTADLVQEIKTASSRWIKTKDQRYESFAWQRGYGYFSVGMHQRKTVENYVRTQKQHHVKNSFQDEFRDMLHRAGIEYDERYIWD